MLVFCGTCDAVPRTYEPRRTGPFVELTLGFPKPWALQLHEANAHPPPGVLYCKDLYCACTSSLRFSHSETAQLHWPNRASRIRRSSSCVGCVGDVVSAG